ncbi:MAG: LPS assembly lipoprotein LptE [Hyphomonadaceae bacterium]
MRSPLRTFALLALPAVLLSACGFRPMYGASATTAPIGPLFVETTPGKGGFALKNELERLLDVERGAGPVRRLQVTLSEGVAGLGFRVDESASRSDLSLSASYILYDVSGAELLRGSAAATASYDVPSSAYGELTAQEDARERAAEVLAERLRADLALRLARQRAQAAADKAK